MQTKTKELRSRYHAARKPETIVTLFGVDYTAGEFANMMLKSTGIMFACYFLFLGLYLVVPSW